MLNLDGAAGTSDSMSGSLNNFQTLNKDGQGTWTLTGPLMSNGGQQPIAVTVNAGTLALAGDNTNFHGSVLVNSAGTLQGAALGIPLAVTDNGSVVFLQQPSDGTYAGIISGQGSVTKAGSGTTILTGSNTYSGGTTISAGTLQLGSGGTTGTIVGNVVDNGVLAFKRSDAVTFPA
ncbi:MAG: autotransporter-associated beta strand repeat-containing protein [Acetobacteraceae bacterium]|nr:autotransporter-associated beta strand repeat-containing protein [Acetobacteraceae bacterium]